MTQHASCFTPSFHQASVSAAELRRDLRAALDGGTALRMAYQTVHGRDGEVVGAEALVRWDHASGEIAPPVLVPLAEATDMIVEIGRRNLREVCAALRSVDVPWISVNASPAEILDPAFADGILATLAEFGLSGDRLWIEITETSVMFEPDPVRAVLAKLREAGVRIALDDFGTGYSSLAQIRAVPLDKIKVDRSVMTDAVASSVSRAVAAATVGIARSLGIRVAAEGVEDAGVEAAATAIGFDEFQGFYLSRPTDLAGLVVALA